MNEEPNKTTDEPVVTSPVTGQPAGQTINTSNAPTNEPIVPVQPAGQPGGAGKKGKIALVIGLAILVIGAGIAFAFLRSNSEPKKADPQTNTQTQDTTSALTAADVTTKAKELFAAKHTLVESSIDKPKTPKEGEVAYSVYEFAPAYKSEGYEYYTDYDGGSTLSLTPYAGEDATLPYPVEVVIREDLVKFLTELKLEKTESRGSSEQSSVSDIYTGRGVICELTGTQNASSPTNLTCGELDKYGEMAAKVKPFADVYPLLDEKTMFSSLEIQDSETEGYQKAQVSTTEIGGIGGSAAIFYKKGDAPWVYFDNVQGPPACSDLNTVDLKNAFKGEQCYNEGVESTVQ